MSENVSTVNVQVNGEPRAVPVGQTLAEWIASLGLPPQTALVEYNGQALLRTGLGRDAAPERRPAGNHADRRRRLACPGIFRFVYRWTKRVHFGRDAQWIERVGRLGRHRAIGGDHPGERSFRSAGGLLRHRIRG